MYATKSKREYKIECALYTQRTHIASKVSALMRFLDFVPFSLALSSFSFRSVDVAHQSTALLSFNVVLFMSHIHLRLQSTTDLLCAVGCCCCIHRNNSFHRNAYKWIRIGKVHKRAQAALCLCLSVCALLFGFRFLDAVPNRYDIPIYSSIPVCILCWAINMNVDIVQ